MIKFAIFLVSLLAIISCKTPSGTIVTPQSKLSLQIVPDYNGEPLIMYKTYTFNGKPIQFTRFSFILSRLCDATSKDYDSRQTQFDFSVITDETSALNGITNTIPTFQDTIKNLLIGFGVDSIDNSILPAQQPQNSPLSNGLNYWDAWNSFIFLKIEGKYDKDGDGIFETPFNLHTGGNQIYTEKTYNLNKSLTSNSSIKLLFNLNLAKILSGVDLNTTTQTHKTGDLPVMNLMMNSLNTAFIFIGSFPN